MISDNKILAHLARGKKPVTADVFITDYCNNKCPYCTYERYGTHTGTNMTLEQFKANVTRVREWGVKGVILTGGGEPTVNPDFKAITEWLEQEKIAYGINTNFNKYFEFSPKYLKVSLDAWDEDSYKAARGVRAYQKTVDNIKRYADFKERTGGTTQLGIQMCATSVSDVVKFYDANKNLPVDYIVFRPIESTRCSYYESQLNRYIADAIVNKLKWLADKDSRVKINYKWYELDTIFDECLTHWSQVAMNERGELIYCCHKPYEKICHVMDEDAKEKYYSSETDISMCDVPCRLTGPNKKIQEILSLDESEFL